MKVIVIGGTSYIGSRILSDARAAGSAIGTSSRASPTLLRLDLGTPAVFEYSVISPGDIVFLAAANSSPDFCAQQYADAYAINVAGTCEFVARTLDMGARVVFFSSDTVYGADRGPVDESAQCNPVGEYAAMKHEVEQRFAGVRSFKSLRLSYVFSRSDKFTQYLLRCAREATVAEIFHPFYRSVVHLGDVVDAAFALASNWSEPAAPVINVGGPELVSRRDIAELIKQSAAPGLAYTTATPPADFFLKRPQSIDMRSPRLAALLGRPARTLKEASALEFE